MPAWVRRMRRKPPLASTEDLPLEQLAATAQMLADGLVAAARRSDRPAQQRPRLQLVGANDSQATGDASLLILARCYLRARRLREGLFQERIFADPAWDMLLELYACRLEGRKLSVSDACNAASVPPTTALRWVDRLAGSGVLKRYPDPKDSRRIYVELTAVTAWRMELWLKATFQTHFAD